VSTEAVGEETVSFQPCDAVLDGHSFGSLHFVFGFLLIGQFLFFWFFVGQIELLAGIKVLEA